MIVVFTEAILLVNPSSEPRKKNRNGIFRNFIVIVGMKPAGRPASPIGELAWVTLTIVDLIASIILPLPA